jgi:predicted small lipoprotein YifL
MMVRGRPVPVLALLAVLCGALALAGCGRKSGLDLPPQTSVEGDAAQAADKASPISPVNSLAGSRGSKRELPPVPSPKRPLPIDVLVD